MKQDVGALSMCIVRQCSVKNGRYPLTDAFPHCLVVCISFFSEAVEDSQKKNSQINFLVDEKIIFNVSLAAHWYELENVFNFILHISPLLSSEHKTQLVPMYDL